MRVSEALEQELEQKMPGEIFTYKDLQIPAGKTTTLIKTLSKLYRQGVIRKISKGLYYLPRQTEFGEVSPNINEVIARVLEVQGATVSYLTGINAYSSLFLTTQLSTEVVIATDAPRNPIQLRGNLLKFVSCRVTKQPSNDLLPQLLDALSDIRVIPDAEPSQIIKTVMGYIKKLTPSEKEELGTIAELYPPATRALLGLCFDVLKEKSLAFRIKTSLNPVSTYKTGIQSDAFTTSYTWNLR